MLSNNNKKKKPIPPKKSLLNEIHDDTHDTASNGILNSPEATCAKSNSDSIQRILSLEYILTNPNGENQLTSLTQVENNCIIEYTNDKYDYDKVLIKIDENRGQNFFTKFLWFDFDFNLFYI